MSLVRVLYATKAKTNKFVCIMGIVVCIFTDKGTVLVTQWRVILNIAKEMFLKIVLPKIPCFQIHIKKNYDCDKLFKQSCMTAMRYKLDDINFELFKQEISLKTKVF